MRVPAQFRELPQLRKIRLEIRKKTKGRGSVVVDRMGPQRALEYAEIHNVICIASGGNGGKKETVYPAANDGAVGVGSTDALDHRSIFSDYGSPSVRLAAPGEALITTYPGNNYAGVWGTSFSAAVTSGAAALLVQIAPGLSLSNYTEVLKHGHPLGDDLDLGDVRLDLYASTS